MGGTRGRAASRTFKIKSQSQRRTASTAFHGTGMMSPTSTRHFDRHAKTIRTETRGTLTCRPLTAGSRIRASAARMTSSTAVISARTERGRRIDYCPQILELQKDLPRNEWRQVSTVLNGFSDQEGRQVSQPRECPAKYLPSIGILGGGRWELMVAFKDDTEELSEGVAIG